MRVLLAGDTHGDITSVIALMKEAKELDADLFILGDFGYWEHTQEGKLFLDAIEKCHIGEGPHAEWGTKDVVVRFLDGNHDNHPMLWSLYGKDPRGVCRVRKGLYYHGRGFRWEWDGVSFMSLGGGYSIDKEYRKPWKSWWETELITDDDVAFAIRRGGCDVLLCHDAPQVVNLTTHGGHGAFKQGIKPSEDNRELLQRVINIKEPRYVFHGHMHINYVEHHTVGEWECRIQGLAQTDTYGGVSPWEPGMTDQERISSHVLHGSTLLTIENGEVRVGL